MMTLFNFYIRGIAYIYYLLMIPATIFSPTSIWRPKEIPLTSKETMVVYINPNDPLEFSLGPVVNSRFEVFFNRLRQVTKEIGADEPKLRK